MGLLPFRIHTDGVGGRYEIDGVPIDGIRAARIDLADGEITTLTVELGPGAGPIEGAAVVQVATHNPAALVAEFLAAVDPAGLERVALNGDLSQGVIPAVLAELTRLAEAHPWT